MPKRLPTRWRAECIREFRASARERFDDALALAAAGRRTGSIYLWGYCAEMLLKAAYFSMLGLTETAVISVKGHISPAIFKGKNSSSSPGHRAAKDTTFAPGPNCLSRNVQPWGKPYPVLFGVQVQRNGQRIGQLWSEQLRYHKNVAYAHEVTHVREAAEWLLTNSDRL